jgi:hypothetical protein
VSISTVQAGPSTDNDHNCFAFMSSPQTPRSVEVKMARKYLQTETVRCF